MKLKGAQEIGIKSVLKAWLIGGFAAGILDAAAAIVILRAPFSPLFKYIASALLGVRALRGGNEMVLTGIVLHLLIAFAWSFLYVAMCRSINLHRLSNVFVIIAYGVLIWVVMNLLIVPITLVPKSSLEFKPVIMGILIIIGAVAAPIVLITNYFLSKNS
jgi:hypothetical protein